MGAGAGAGLGIRGYYDGKQRRDQSRQTDYTFDRDKMLDEILDPINIRSAERADDKSEMERPNDQANVDYKQAENEQKARRGIRSDEISEMEKPNDQANVDMQQQEREITNRSAIRGDKVSTMQEPYDQANVDRQERTNDRKDKIGGMIATQQENQYNDQQKIRGAQDADQLVEMGAGVTAFDDFYDEFYPNTPGTTTTEDPNIPGNYIVTMDDGTVHDSVPLEQLRKGFMETFTNPDMVQRIGGYGNIGQNRGVSGIRGNRSGGYGAAPSTEKERTVNDINRLLMEMPENRDRNPAEVRLEAYQVAVQRGSIPLETAVRDLYADLLKAYSSNAYDEEGRAEAETMARQGAATLLEFDPSNPTGNDDDIGAILDAAMGEG